MDNSVKKSRIKAELGQCNSGDAFESRRGLNLLSVTRIDPESQMV